jgi:Ca-activated chloride channel family protein
MTFASPALLWTLALIPVALAVYLIAQRRRVAAARRFASPDMMGNVVLRSPSWRRHVPVVLTLVALALLLAGLARPELALSVPRERATVVLAIDSSNSMNATDVEPSRLAAARAAASDFLDRLPQRFQIGVVSFARRARTLSRPTTDRVALRRALASLETSPGTALGEGLLEALDMRPQSRGRPRAPVVVVLLSDGNNTTGVDPAAAADAARADSVPVHTIALGTRTGRAPPGGRSARPFNVEGLRDVARRTGGSFNSAPSETDLQGIYGDLGSSISSVRERREVTVAFVAGGLALLVVGGALSTLWFSRPWA